MNKILPLAAAVGIGLVGCSAETAAPGARSELRGIDIREMSSTTTIKLGETAFVAVASSDDISRIIAAVAIIDHVYPNGGHDVNAPIVTETPMRVNVQTMLYGDSQLSNDASCETYGVSGTPASISAVALGGELQDVFIAWPKPDYMYACTFQDGGPSRDDGMVVFANQP